MFFSSSIFLRMFLYSWSSSLVSSLPYIRYILIFSQVIISTLHRQWHFAEFADVPVFAGGLEIFLQLVQTPVLGIRAELFFMIGQVIVIFEHHAAISNWR